MMLVENGILGIGAYFGAQCEKHGMLVRVAGDNIMMSPPLTITPDEIDEVCCLILLYLWHAHNNERIKF